MEPAIFISRTGVLAFLDRYEQHHPDTPLGVRPCIERGEHKGYHAMIDGAPATNEQSEKYHA